MSDLSDAARAELREALRIIREDKFEQYARTTLAKHGKSEPPSIDPPTDPPKKDGPTPPPPSNDPPKDPAPEGQPPKRDAWWGELLNDA